MDKIENKDKKEEENYRKEYTNLTAIFTGKMYRHSIK